MKTDKYINDVLKNISADQKTLTRIEEDLLERIELAKENDPFFDIVQEIGHPLEVAQEFNDNLELNQENSKTIGISKRISVFEYKSKKGILGIPLVHINVGGRYQNRVAKGVIAVGDISIGVLSLGGVSLGALSFGGLALGGVAVGGFALGGLAAGGIATGILAIGGIAFGLHAIGGIAIGIFKAIGDKIFLL